MVSGNCIVRVAFRLFYVSITAIINIINIVAAARLQLVNRCYRPISEIEVGIVTDILLLSNFSVDISTMR